MRRLLSAVACGLLALGASACKDPEVAAEDARIAAAHKRLTEGRHLLAAGQAEKAVPAFKAASSMLPNDPTPLLLLAEAQRGTGNDAAAILALKQAQALTQNAEPSLRKRLAELYREEGHDAQAVAVLVELRDAGELSDEETLMLAMLQAHAGDPEGGFKTLEVIQRTRPDDPEAKAVEAEILLVQGDEVAATKILDRLVAEYPKQVSARVLRARYFLNNGFAEHALRDLFELPLEESRRPDVVGLKARVLNQLQRYDEAEAALQPLMQGNPRDVELLAQLAEVKLNLGQTVDAEALVDRALGIRPNFPRALYVRGRALEVDGHLDRAEDTYRAVLAASPGFAPALSRIWRIYEQQGKHVEAMSALERLLYLNEASVEEKASLAELYAEARIHPTRARQLIDDALRREPKNARYKAIAKEVAKAAPKAAPHRPAGPEIIRIK